MTQNPQNPYLVNTTKYCAASDFERSLEGLSERSKKRVADTLAGAFKGRLEAFYIQTCIRNILQHHKIKTVIPGSAAVFTEDGILLNDGIGRVETLSKRWRVCQCMRSSLSPLGVHIKIGRISKKAFFSNLLVCGSIWVCPVCAQKIAERRRAILEKLIESTKDTHSQDLVTLTFAHQFQDDLSLILPAQIKAFHAMYRNRPWRRFAAKWGIKGFVRVLEITYSDSNGFHPHFHLIFWRDKLNLSSDQFQEYQAEFLALWRSGLAKHGLTCDDLHGVKVDSTDKRVSDYVSKFGKMPSELTIGFWDGWGIASELTRSARKVKRLSDKTIAASPRAASPLAGSTPWEWAVFCQSAELAGDKKSAAKWAGIFRKYALATRGKKQLQYSNWVSKQIKLLGIVEKTDLELALEQQEAADLFAIIRYQDYRLLCRYEYRVQLIAVCQDAFEHDDFSVLTDWLDTVTGRLAIPADKLPEHTLKRLAWAIIGIQFPKSPADALAIGFNPDQKSPDVFLLGEQLPADYVLPFLRYRQEKGEDLRPLAQEWGVECLPVA